MNRNKPWTSILFPHPALLWTLPPVAAGMLIYSAVTLDSSHPVSILSYALSFYALVIVSLRVPDIIRFAKRFRQENRYARRYTTDVRFRMNFSLARAFVFNAAYALFQLCLGIKHHSAWFYAMAGYYLLLAMMRLMLVRYTKGHAPGEQLLIEWKKYRLCGICLMLVTFALAIFILYFVWNIREFRHHEITTIAMAAYTFTALTLAIVNAVRYRKYGSPAYSAAKAISLASAAVSMLVLENGMLTAFGQDSGEAFRRIMLGASGVAVILAVQAIAVYMIVNSARKIRSLRRIGPQ